MPELAEVEHARRTWDVGLGQRIVSVRVSPNAGSVMRDIDPATLQRAVQGETFLASEARGKQICLRFGDAVWIGLHLGMEGSLSVKSARHEPEKHDLLILRQRARCLVFTDLRHFGRVRLHLGTEPPAFWTALAPSILSPAFTLETVRAFLRRRPRSPLKTVLLDQRGFPGIGNWMADEVLWRARLRPNLAAGALDDAEAATLYRTLRRVSSAAIRVIDENWEYPRTWLFRHRWQDGGRCPRCRKGLKRVLIGGRRTCFCPTCQGAV